MMLPGVELARKRRIHHHGSGQEALASPRGSNPAGPSTSMAESALLARRRLEEKLRGFGLGSSAAQSPITFSRRNPVGGEPGGPSPRRGAPATRVTAANSTVTATQTKKPLATQAAAAAAAAAGGRPAAALERADSAADDCAVCLDGLRRGEGRQVLNLPCSHRYHWDCVLPWLAEHPNCPSCRTPVPS